MAATLLREPVGIWEVLGTLLVLAGVTLTTLAPARVIAPAPSRPITS